MFLNYSFSSPRWDYLSTAQKQLLEFNPNDDGEFWMEFKHFLYFFTQLEMVHLSVAAHLDLPKSPSGWLRVSHHGGWKANSSAGGCLGHSID